MDIIEGNKLIAQFMAENPVSDLSKNWQKVISVTNPDATQYRYDESWDHIFSVILKIRGLHFAYRGSNERMQVEFEGIIWNWKAMDRGSCYKRILRFIQWYNTQSTPTHPSTQES